MDQQTTGLIIRTRLLTDTSLIVHWITQDFGRLATVAKGARRPKSPFAGKLDLFYLDDLSFRPSRSSDLHILREATLRQSYPALRQDLGRLQQAAYCAALIEQTTEPETPLPELFKMFKAFVELLARLPAQPLNVFAFEMKLLADSGLKPNLQATELSAGSRQILHKLMDMDWQMLCNLKLSAAQTTEIDRFLRNFLLHQFGNVPRGREACTT